jgi:hypothetical protein
MKGGNAMNYLKKGSKQLLFIKYPKFLLTLELGITSKLVYAMLFDRAKASCENPSYIDADGKVFVIFTISELSKTIGKSEMTVKNAFSVLEKAKLIERKFIGVGKPSHIYILYPDENLSEDKNGADKNAPQRQNVVDEKQIPVDDKVTTTQTENDTPRRQFSGKSEDKKLSGINKIYNNKKLIRKDDIYICGQFTNVKISVDELEQIKKDIPKWYEYIERLSSYMMSTGKDYPNHAATIRQWALKDHAVINQTDYSGSEEDCI